MSASEALDSLRSRILSDFTLLFLDTWEERRWEKELSILAEEMERGFVVWSVTEGPRPPLEDVDGDSGTDPLKFLDQIVSYPANRLFLLKDFHPYLSDPRVVRKLRDLTAVLAAEGKAVLLIGPQPEIPLELRKESLKIPLPLPGLEELRVELASVLDERCRKTGATLEVSAAQEEKLLKAILGLTAGEARKALARALLDRDELDDEVYSLLVSEKKHMVQGSEMLEFQELKEGVADVGGLEGLKDWIRRRADAFTERAREHGIPAPKGVLLLGVQGCGKSLTARAVAKLLSFPLVRLDVATLLSSDLGMSEKNMRDVLTLMEMICPAVLWLDEIEKGFAGSSGEGGSDATMVRIMGRFLTWMQENPSPVFVIATANSVTGLPPEMLRRGRFDELFFIDLPNYHERIDICNIHLAKRDWVPENFAVKTLAEKTEGFSGAEIEQIVVAAMVETFASGGVLTDADLEKARDETVPLSVTMEEKIFELREWARPRCRPATPDSRVLQMLEAEQREQGQNEDVAFGEDADLGDSEDEWVVLAEQGRLDAAVVEYIRQYDRATFAQLQQAFADHVETEGEQGLALRSDPNIVLFLGMSRELAGVLAKLISAQKLYLHPTRKDEYPAEGGMARLPALEELPENRISRPAWLPVCVSDIAPEGGSSNLTRVARMKLSK